MFFFDKSLKSSYYGSQIPGINMTDLYENMLTEFDHEDFMERTHSTGLDFKKTYIELSLPDKNFWNSLKVDIIKCRFGIIDCTAMMKTVKTMYGYCKEGQPSRFVGIGDSPKWQRDDV